MAVPPSTSLTGKLLFWVTLITAATLIAVVLASTNVARGVLQRQIQRSTESAAEDVALELVAARDPVGLINSPAWANKLLHRLQLRGGLRGVQIEVLSRGRTSRLEAASEEDTQDPLITFEEVPLGQLMARVSDANQSIEVVLRHALIEGELAIRMVASTEVIFAFGHAISVNAIWMGIGAWIILVSTIALLINRTIIRPLRNVAEAMGDVSEGRLGEHISPVGTAEVDPLIHAFNHMSSLLETAEHDRTTLIDEVEGLNRDLQTRVDLATAQLAKARDDLARRDRLAVMGELVGTIAHEVGTPLNSVLAHLDLLGDELPGDSSRQRLELAMNEIERVSDIIRRYLKSTKAPTPKPAPVHVKEILRDALRLVEVEARSHKITLELHCDDEPFDIDHEVLSQIVRNLVSNAIHALESGGRVIIRGAINEQGLTIDVIDNGVGMSTETKERIFEPFYSARLNGTGTGLGMSIVRNAVSSLNGRVAVESSPGAGCTVSVSVPHPTTCGFPDSPPTRGNG